MKSDRIGDLLVHVWPAATAAGMSKDAPVVLAAHGITANGLSWGRVAQLLDGRVTLVAPDLRGRAGSRDAAGPYGMGRHADDLIALLDALEIDRAVLAGHSMGAFIAAVAAARYPERVAGAVLVDGGLAFPAPPGTDIDAVLAAVLGPAVARLSMTFPDRDAYRKFWQEHPAFAQVWTPEVEAYIQHDLVGDGPYHSSCVADVIRTDGAQVLVDAETLGAIHALTVPAVLLYAERGMLDDPRPLYDAERVAGLEIPAVAVPGTNHYSILIGDEGAQVVADHILRAAGVAG